MVRASQAKKKSAQFDPSELNDLIFSPAVGNGVASHLLEQSQFPAQLRATTVDLRPESTVVPSGQTTVDRAVQSTVVRTHPTTVGLSYESTDDPSAQTAVDSTDPLAAGSRSVDPTIPALPDVATTVAPSHRSTVVCADGTTVDSSSGTTVDESLEESDTFHHSDSAPFSFEAVEPPGSVDPFVETPVDQIVAPPARWVYCRHSTRN